MPSEPLALLARQGAFLRAQQGAAFLAAIEPYLRVLKGTPRISPHLEALRQEAYEIGRAQSAREARPASVAYRIEEDILAQERALVDDGEILGFTSLRTLFHDFNHPAIASLRTSGTRDHGRTARIIRSVSAHMDVVDWQRRHANPDAVKRQFANLSLEQEQNHARFLLETRSSAGVALLRLERTVEILTPPDQPLERPALIVDAGNDEQTVRDAVFGEPRHADAASLAQLISELARASEQLELELHRRVDTVLSRLALVERYRARVEWHDRERVAELAATERVAEARLRDDFARYLFDQGLDPLTELRVGVLRADVVDPLVRPTFFVEAKRHDGSRTPEAVVRDAFRQTIDTASHLYAQLRPDEAFVVIFRTAGARMVSLPVDPISINGLDVYVRMIDLAPAAASGSRATETPHRFSLEELETLALASE